jgi:hypothetical protein
MAKRFIDTSLFDDSWYMKLKPTTKLVFIYFITNCDHAGIIDFNVELAEFKTKIKGLANSWPTVAKEFDNHLVTLRDNYYFMPSFIKFQYPKGLNTNVKAQNSVINRLKEFDLFDEENQRVIKGLSNSYLTVQDKDKDKDKERDKDKNKGFKAWSREDFWKEIIKACDGKEYAQGMIEEFFRWWSEPDTNNQMKFQLKETWSTAGRLVTWSKKKFD